MFSHVILGRLNDSIEILSYSKSGHIRLCSAKLFCVMLDKMTCEIKILKSPPFSTAQMQDCHNKGNVMICTDFPQLPWPPS